MVYVTVVTQSPIRPTGNSWKGFPSKVLVRIDEYCHRGTDLNYVSRVILIDRNRRFTPDVYHTEPITYRLLVQSGDLKSVPF